MDEQQRGRIRDDLSGQLRGELLFDEVTRAAYSTDASAFQVRPAGVVVPRDEDDLCALVRYAHDHEVPLIARGAGTGLAGEALGTGLVVDLSRHFRAILEVGADTVRVQPGVTLTALNQRLAEQGRRFAPDPASAAVCTLGGMLANDASGARALKHGYTHNHVAALRIVLDNGDAVTVGHEPVPQPGDVDPSHLHDILLTLAVLLEQHASLLLASRPRVPFDRCGYRLDGVLAGNTLDVPRLLVGSEGTLALFTEATLRTIPLPGGRSTALLAFARMDDALRAALRTLATGPTACELMDRRLLSLVRGSDAGQAAALVPPEAEAALLVEYETETAAEAPRLARDLVENLMAGEPRAIHATTGTDPAAAERLWKLREAALPSLYGLKGGVRPVPLIEDVAVPIEALPDFLRRVQEVLQAHETTASYLVHAGTGQVHTRPFLDLGRPADASKLRALADEVHGLALALGGTVTSQHGTGLARTPWVARQAGPLYAVYRQVKAAFDPKNVFNPGKIVDPDPGLAPWPLRTAADPAAPSSPALRWTAGEVAAESNHCNGCGQCRDESPVRRMCPIFRATGDERATPRAKANVLRLVLADEPGIPLLGADEVREIADLCVNCKMCASECPARVNVPKLMLEAKAANVAAHGLGRTGWFLSHLEGFLRWGSALAFVSNLILGSRSGRWLLGRLFGLAPRIRLPRFAPRPFMARAKRRGWTRRTYSERPTVVYFADLYANYVDPQIAEAAVAVLQHNGFDVIVPAGQRGSGVEALVQGDVERAREMAQRNLRELAELAREGLPIICSEPGAALMLRHDYLDLLDDTDALLVAGRTVELTAFLWELHRAGKLRTDFRPLELGIGHHVPCHVKALGVPAGPLLLGLIPRLRVHTIDVSCSGMAGTFGLRAENEGTARAAGAPMLRELDRPRALFGSTECSSCRMQMEGAGGKRTLHPVEYLALAYGLSSDAAQRLQEPMRELLLR